MNINFKFKLTNVIITSLMAIWLLGCKYTKTEQEKIDAPEPFLPIPNKAQLNWHKAEYIMFAHFGMKTFYPSNDHMGYGKEDPTKFNPVGFNAKQWVEAAKAGGFKGIVITAKHHDGFCNWQTETTDHSVKSSPWKNGKGEASEGVLPLLGVYEPALLEDCFAPELEEDGELRIRDLVGFPLRR